MDIRELDFSGTARFEIRRRLGAGGMGVVYEAFDRERRARVALKTLRRVDGQAIYRLKREFRALQDVQHPNLVWLGDLIEEGGQWFFTMELVDGVDFLGYVRARGDDDDDAWRIPSGLSPTAESLRDELAAVSRGARAWPGHDEPRLRGALGQLALGLEALHAAGKIHRDIKPSNVHVTRAGRVVLLDFGLISDARGDATGGRDETEPHVAGTAEYMAPEQAASRPLGPAADWYSVGVMLYQALTGRLPFSGRPLEILMNKQSQDAAPPRAHVPDLPPDLDALCAELLRFDPAARPTGRDVLARLGLDTSGPALSVGSADGHTRSAIFLGRDAELGALRDAFDDARRGKQVTVAVRGESGIGKSALIRRFTRELEADVGDVIVLSGRCYERESVPYKAFDGVVDALSRYLRELSNAEADELVPRNASLLRRMFPVLGRVEVIAQAPPPRQEIRDALELRRRVFSAVRELLCRLADRRPLVLVIDDLQWADADSLLLLSDVLRPPEPPPLLLVVASRTEPADTAPASEPPAIPGGGRAIDLAPLDAESGPQLARMLLERARPDARADDAALEASAIAAEAGGHPLYIDELVRHAGGERPGLRLDEAIWARVATLPAPPRRVLELVACAGEPLPQGTIREAARMDSAEFDRHVSLLRVANLVRGRGGDRDRDGIAVYHDYVRKALLENLDAATVVERHQRLAVALETTGVAADRPEILLRHLEASGQHERAAGYAVEAGRRAAAAFAFDRAAQLYRAALRLAPADTDDERRPVRVALGEALANAGRSPEAAEVFLAAAQGADRSTRLHCRRQAAEQLLISGHIERGLEVLRSLLGEIGVALPETPRRALASLLWHRARLRLSGLQWTPRDASEIPASDLTRLDVYKAVAHGLGMVDPIRGADFQARMLRLALRTGEPLRAGRALTTEATYLANEGAAALPRARAVAAQARAIAETTGDPFLRAWVLLADGILGFFGSEFVTAAEVLERAEAMLRDETAGATWELNGCRLFRLFSLRNMGAFRKVATLHDDYLRDAVHRGDRYAETSMRRYCNVLALVADDPVAAEDNLARATWLPPEGVFHLQHWFELESRAEMALYQGRAGAALRELAPAFAGLGSSLLRRVQNVRCLEWWLRGRLLLSEAGHGGDGRARLGEVTRLARKLDKERIGFATVYARLLAAGAAQRAGRDAPAAAAYRDAIAAAEDSHMGLCAAAARLRLGELVGGDEGAGLIERAETWMRGEAIAAPSRMAATAAP